MASHGVADRLDRVGDVAAPELADLERVARQLAASGVFSPCDEIGGGAAAGALDLGVARLEKGVDFGNQRPNFQGARSESSAASACDSRDFVAKRLQGPQAEAELHECGEAENEGEHGKTCHQVRDKGVPACRSRVRSVATMMRAAIRPRRRDSYSVRRSARVCRPAPEPDGNGSGLRSAGRVAAQEWCPRASASAAARRPR